MIHTITIKLGESPSKEFEMSDIISIDGYRLLNPAVKKVIIKALTDL